MSMVSKNGREEMSEGECPGGMSRHSSSAVQLLFRISGVTQCHTLPSTPRSGASLTLSLLYNIIKLFGC